MFRKSIFIWLFALICVDITIAQVPTSYLGPQLGWQKASDADNAKLMVGGAYRIKLSPSFGLEASVHYRSEDYDNGDVSVTSWPVMVTALIYPLPIVYGAIGAGWYNTSITYSSALHLFGANDETEQKFGWHFGAGLEIPLGMSMSNPGAILTADIRYVFLNYDFQQFPGTQGLKNDFVYMTVGLLFNL
ncbi:MAG: outer membrane beta-barrel protein [Ignavibacteriaceae bacterium]|nr:outer membrane beta-barrel protein [Ignavibacteriaceae bacterium]